MSYVMRGVVGRIEALESVVKTKGAAHVRRLDESFGLIPLTDRLYDEITASSGTLHPFDQFVYLSKEVADWLLECSKTSPVAYLEAEYRGGVGEQSSIVFDARAVIVGPEKSGTVGPINKALRAIGVRRSGASDEFETVRLGRHRQLDDWLEQA